MSDFVYTVTTEIDPAYIDEFNAWQETEHCPLLLEVKGFHSVIRCRDLNDPNRFINIWHIDSMESFNDPERKQKAVTPWTERLNPHRNRYMEFYCVKDWETVSAEPLELAPEVSALWIHELEDLSLLDLYETEQFSAIENIPKCVGREVYYPYEERARSQAVVIYFLTGDIDHLRQIAAKHTGDVSDMMKKGIKSALWACCSKHKSRKN